MIVFTDPAEAGKLICCPGIIAVTELAPDPFPPWFVPDYEVTPRERRLARAWRWLMSGRADG